MKTKHLFFLALVWTLMVQTMFAQNTLQSKPTVTTPAGDDWLYVQGATNNVRKLSPLYYLPAATAATTYQPIDADLTALAALTGTNTLYYRSASNTWTAVTIGSNLTFSAGTLSASVTGGGGGDMLKTENLSGLANYSTARTNMGLAIGTNVQAYDADLDTWAAKTAPSGTPVGTTDTQTLLNKRNTRRVATPASATSIAVNGDTTDVCKINALTHNVTFATPSGTPTEGQTLTYELRASGGDRTVDFSADHRIPSSSALTLPITVVSGTKTKIVVTRDNDSAKWDFVAVVSGY